jgi:molybdate transport system substrate-binding protein
MLWLLLAVLAPQLALAAEVRLSVAASMNEAIKELVRGFGVEHPDVTVLVNFGASGSLAKQIVQGAPADLYIAANDKWMTYLVTEQKMAAATVRVFARNALVFVGGPGTTVESLTELASLDLIALGSPQSVPAGQYAAQAMQAVGVYDQLVAAHKLVLAKDVRQALLYAERGEVDGAFVYRTDAQAARQAAILFTVAAELHEPIVYPLGLTMAGAQNSAAQAFYAYLASPAAAAVIQAHGFTPAEQ